MLYTGDLCADGTSPPDPSFRFNPADISLASSTWTISEASAGSVPSSGMRLNTIPDATDVSCVISRDGTDYDLAFLIDRASSSVTISVLAAR